MGSASCGTAPSTALDRLARRGAEDALRLIRLFRERGCTILGVRESWLNGSPEVQDVLVAFAGWMAQQESARRSDRIKAGIARRKAEGLPAGRKTSATDSKPRKRSSYYARYEKARLRGRHDDHHTAAHLFRLISALDRGQHG
jgi:DNA invertase Pin-like site-specific DNA recombinase